MFGSESCLSSAMGLHSLSVISSKCLPADRVVFSIIPETSEFS